MSFYLTTSFTFALVLFDEGFVCSTSGTEKKYVQTIEK